MIEHNDSSKKPLSKEKLRQAINTIVAEMEEKEHDTERNANNVTMDTFCQPPSTTNKQGKIAKVPNKN